MIVGYCCGVFDLGHVGHINFLRGAKACCDHLIVGVVRDAAVKKQKGEYRPILTERERMDWLLALDIADEVMYQETFNPSKEMEYATYITLFLKGADQQHIDESYAKENLIEVIYLPRTIGISTTEIEKRILNANSL